MQPPDGGSSYVPPYPTTPFALGSGILINLCMPSASNSFASFRVRCFPPRQCALACSLCSPTPARSAAASALELLSPAPIQLDALILSRRFLRDAAHATAVHERVVISQPHPPDLARRLPWSDRKQ